MDFSLLIPIFLGLLAGGLINYLADVLPHTLRLSPRSSGVSRPLCLNPDCKAAFRWTDTLLLRRCSKCGGGRGIRTYAVLILAEALSIFIWFSPPHTLGFALGLAVLTYLLLVTVIDLEHRLILRPLSLAGLILAALAGIYVRGWLSTLIGGAAGFGIMFVFYLFGRLFTRWRLRRLGTADQEPPNYGDEPSNYGGEPSNYGGEPSNYGGEEALGSGDVTLATILGLLLGWPLIWFCLLMGVFIAGIVSLLILARLLISKQYGQKALMVFIPYGPPFILSAILMVYFPHWMVYLAPR